MKNLRVTLIPMFLLTVGLTVSGCAALFDKNLGSKVMLNNSAQVVKPDAIYEEGNVVTIEGQMAENLMSRYRKEEAAAPTEKLLKSIGN